MACSPQNSQLFHELLFSSSFSLVDLQRLHVAVAGAWQQLNRAPVVNLS